MEFITVVTAVYQLAKTLNDWLDQRAEKEAIIKQLSITTSQIHNILRPFNDMHDFKDVEKPLFDAVWSVGDVLKRTQEHLVVWEYKRSRRIVAFLSPSTVIQQLQDDERRLSQQLMLLVTSITVVRYVDHRQRRITGHDSDSKVEKRLESEPEPMEPVVLDTINNQEVKQFWHDYIGKKIVFVSSDEFRSRLSICLGMELSPSSWRTLNLRLDEFGIGGITPSNLEAFVGQDQFKSAIQKYVQAYDIRSEKTFIRPQQIMPTNAPKLPLIIWIDDKYTSIEHEISHAHSLGINVVHLTSTAVAKAWIDSNSNFLRRNNNPSLIRVISDNHRNESSNPFLNLTAGENILRYLRGRFLNIPVLIYTCFTIQSTGYVSSYEMAGSTFHFTVCMDYINGLAVGNGEDVKDMKFMMEPGMDEE